MTIFEFVEKLCDIIGGEDAVNDFDFDLTAIRIED